MSTPTPQIGFESNDPVVSQILNGVNQQPHYSAVSLMSGKAKMGNSSARKKGFSQPPKNDPPCKSIFEQSKRKAHEKIAQDDRISTVGKNLKHAKTQQQAPTTQNRVIPRTATRPPGGIRTPGGTNGRNPLSDPHLDKLASMICTTCKKIVRPGFIFRCIDGHVHCERCKGGSLAEFGRICTICKDVYKKKHRVRPNKVLRETNPHIKEAEKFIVKCNICSQNYYNLGNGEMEHYSQHIDQTWGNLLD